MPLRTHGVVCPTVRTSPSSRPTSGDGVPHLDYLAGMSQPPSAKPKLTAAEQRQRREDRITTIRLHMAIGRKLEEQGITTPAAIGEALGMPAQEAVKLLTHRQWREGDEAALQASAARLGLQVPDQPLLMAGATHDR